jgi:hypothetical protein
MEGKCDCKKDAHGRLLGALDLQEEHHCPP